MPNTTLILEVSLLSWPVPRLASTSAGRRLHAVKLLWRWEPGSAWAGRDAPCEVAPNPGSSSPTARASPGVRQGSASGSIQARSKRGKLRREPNFKVMENSQDQHEGMNFKHVLFVF